MKNYLLPFAASMFLGACIQSPEIAVKKRWVEAVRNFALTPIYPMREDIFVGTLRLSKIEDDNDFTLPSRSLGYVDLSGVLTNSERAKPTYPKPVSKDVKNESGNIAGLVWEQAENPLGKKSAGNRLRLAGLPAVSLVRLTGAEAQNSGGAGAVAAAFEQSANLDIALLGIETLELDDITAAGIFQAEVIERLRSATNQGGLWRSGICASAASMGKSLDQTQITMITRVFYARGIQYSYGNSVAGALNAATPGAELPDAVVPAAREDSDASLPKPAKAANQDPKITLTAPGSVAKFVTRSDDGLVQSEIYERPMAFGYAGIAVDGKNLPFTCEKVGPPPNKIKSQSLSHGLTDAIKANVLAPGMITAGNAGVGVGIAVGTSVGSAAGALSTSNACKDLTQAEQLLNGCDETSQ